ncbi:rod shape-determining protein MreC [Spirulina subsalsa]|uniref:rod shape-determining protein MreC n=1 Tax=Spirulina subsalsa TaxID=54311 RepID=UPI0002E2D0A6|nr:rod shape-determining protein MreC [Spirulina subsalsa]
MFTVRRWWERYGSQLVLTGVVLGIALFIRQTQGAIVSELYYQIVRPFQTGPRPEEMRSNARLLELQAQVDELEQQNQLLKNQLGYVQQRPTNVITAPIIGRSVEHWWEQVTLGRGSKDGIQEGYIVTSPGGLVGRVVKVTPNTSRVLLVSDPTSKVGAVVSRTRYMGFVRGESSDEAVMEFFEKVPDVEKGDKIVTSHVSHLFPPGIPIGQVESVDLEKSPAPEVIVRLTTPIQYLEWVVVEPFEPK